MLDLEPVKENNKTLDLQPIEDNNATLDLEPIEAGALQGGVEQKRFVNRDVNLQSIPVNAMKDLGDITTGIAGLIGGAVNAGVVTPIKRAVAGEPIIQKQDFTNAWETAKQLPGALKQGLKEDYGQANIDMIQPNRLGVNVDWKGLLQSFEAHPLNRALDVLSLGTIGAGKRIADTARLTSKIAKPVGNIEKTLKYSPNLAIEGLQRVAETKPIQSLVNFADKSPALNQLQTGIADFLGAKPESRLLGTVGANKRAAKLLEQKNQIANINQRNAAININKQLLGDITEKEGKQLVQAIERGESLSDRPKVNVGLQAVEEPVQKGLPPLNDNYLKDLSEYTPTLHREMSPEEATKFIGNTSADTTGDLYFSNKPELALGQGKNKGIVIEFDSKGIQGQVNQNKPLWDAQYQQGNAEFIAKYNKQNIYRQNVKSVTIKPDAKFTPVENRVIKNSLKDWTKTVNDDGSITFIKPVQGAIEQPVPEMVQPLNKLENAREIMRKKIEANAEQYIASGNLDKQVAQDLPINQYASIKYNKPIQELTEVEKKSALKDISKLPDEQKPFYVPIMYDEKLKASDFFANTTKSYKAPELRQRKVGMDLSADTGAVPINIKETRVKMRAIKKDIKLPEVTKGEYVRGSYKGRFFTKNVTDDLTRDIIDADKALLDITKEIKRNPTRALDNMDSLENRLVDKVGRLPNEAQQKYYDDFYNKMGKADDYAKLEKDLSAPKVYTSKYGNRVYSPVELMNRLDAHRIKMVNTEKMINEIKDTFAKPYNSKTDTLLDDYVPFNPDSFLKFYRGSIDLNELTMAKLQELDNVDNAFRSAIQESIRQLPEDIKNYMGVAKNNNIYQIPKEVAESLMSGKSSKGGLETLYDTMTGSFKRKVLGLSPKWFINNRIGNGIMASLKGVTPDYLIKAIKTSDNLLPEELKSKSLYEAEKTVIGRTGGGSNGALSSTLRLIGGEFIDTSTLKGLAKAQAMGANVLGVPGAVINKITDAAFKFNQVFENLERKAVYLKNVDKIGKQYIKNVGQKITTQDELLKYAIEEPQLQEQVMKAVDDTLGDYSNMTSAERRIVRKIVPFYSWTRTITRYAMSLPETNPLRADLTAKIMEAQALSMEDSETPEFQKGSVDTGMVNPITGKEYVLNFRRAVPFETFGNIGDTPLAMLNPFWQQLINSGVGRDVTFSDRPYTSRNYETDYGGHFYNKKTGEYMDLPASEKLASFPLNLVRNTIPLAPETEKVLTSLFTGRLPDELYSTSLGGYNYDEVYKKPKGYTMQDQIIKNFLPLQQKAQKRYKK